MGWFKRAGRTWLGSPAFNEVDLGQPFELSKALSSRIGDLGLRLERTAERNNRLRVVATLGDEVTRIPLESLPYSVKRYDIRLLSSTRTRASFEVHEIPCSDEDFLSQDCVPIVSGNFRGIRISAPKDVRVGRSEERPKEAQPPGAPTDVVMGGTGVPSVFSGPPVKVAGNYMFELRALREHGARVTRAEPVIVFTNTNTGAVDRVTMELIRGARDQEVFGPLFQWDDPPPDIAADIEEYENRPPEAFGDDAEGNDFTVDVGPFIKWPQGVTAYIVHAEYGPYRSNEVRITIRNDAA